MADIGKLIRYPTVTNWESGPELWVGSQSIIKPDIVDGGWYAGGSNIDIDWRSIVDKEGFLEWLRNNLFNETCQNKPENECSEPKIDVDQLLDAVFEE